MKSFQNKIPPFFVHLFTGSGIIFSFLALVNVIEGNKLQTFMFLGIALVIDIVDKTYDCIIQTFDKNVSQFYIFADSSNYISNNKAVDKIKKENTEALVKNFINTLNNTSYKCKKIDTLQRKLLLIRDE